MPEIKLQHVVSCSSEDLTHKADNLLTGETYRKWKGSEAGEKQTSVILQFEKASAIHSIDVGNEGSAFIEILVGLSSAGSAEDYQVILVTSSFMSPVESKNGTNTNRVRMFGPDKLTKGVTSKKWDRVKVVCSQPFNKHHTYGLSFIKFHSPPEPGQEKSPKAEGSSKLGHFRLKDDTQSSSSIGPGSYFKNRDKEKEAAPLTGAAAVRAASTLAATSMTSSVTTSQAKQSRRSPSPSRTKQPPQKRRLSDESSERKEKEKARGDGRKEVKEQQVKQPPVKKQRSEPEAPPKESVPFRKLMAGVTFVLSGFQNPFRAELRDKALDMGAKYKPDWAPGCTHLICAFANTPKYNQVKGKGKIVAKQWIVDSHRKKRLMPWRRYQLRSDDSSSDEEDESDTEEEEEKWEPAKKKTPAKHSQSQAKESPKGGKGNASSSSKGKSPMKKVVPKKTNDDDDYGGSTEGESDDEKPPVTKATRRRIEEDEESSGGDTEDELRKIQGKPAKDDDDDYSGSTEGEASDKEQNGKNKKPNNKDGIPELPNFFSGKNFFIYGGFDKEEKRQVKRFIIAFGGILEDYMKDNIQYVITNSTWDDNFDQALTENASLAFVRPKWLYTCNEKSKFVPYQPYVIVPK